MARKCLGATETPETTVWPVGSWLWEQPNHLSSSWAGGGCSSARSWASLPRLGAFLTVSVHSTCAFSVLGFFVIRRAIIRLNGCFLVLENSKAFVKLINPI